MNESIIMNFLQSQNIERNRKQEKQILYLDITELKASKENFYGIRDLETLKASISLKGLLQPILVTKGEEGKYTVLGGGRRRQAIEELVNEGREDLRKVPCIISDTKLQGEDTEDQEEDREMKDLLNRLDIISANSFREKTDWEKLEETVQIGNIIKDLKRLGKIKGNVREMQVELSGTTGTQIARYNAILNNLSEELTEAFKNNDFGISVAYELSRLTEEYQKQAWELFLENKILTLPDTERLHRLQKEAEQIQGQVEMHEWLQKEEACKETEDQEEPEEETKEIKPEGQQETKEESKYEPVKEEQQTEEYEKYEQASEETDIELLKEELEKAQRYLTMLLEAYTEKDIRVRRQKLIVDALAGMLAEIDNEIPEPVQPPLPEMKNNDQRKEWLNNYRSWGIWYKDEHTGATYYRYQFENGADLIVEEYESESEYTGIYISSYLHLIGGPEPVRKSGISKWTRNKKYNRYPNSETELVEFLKELQKGK